MPPRASNPITRKEFEAEMTKLRDTLDRWRVPVQAEIDKHKKSLYGNGEPGLDEIIRDHDKMILKQGDAIEKISESIRPMTVFYKVGVWFASAIGLSVIALIWGILTHSVNLSFP